MIIVTGANGKLGRAIVEQLLQRIPAGQIGVSVREPEKAQALAEKGVQVRQGDFSDPASLDRAFEGVSQLLMISPNTTGQTAITQRLQAIEAAKKAGTQRILYTSHMGSSSTSHFPPMHSHFATEKALQESGVAFTSLRNGFYATTIPMLLGNAFQTGVLAAPADGPVSWTSHPDLAEVAAIALTGNDLVGLTPPLTASEAIDLEGVAAIVSELWQRPVRRVVVPDEEYRATLVGRGVPEAGADMLLGMFRGIRAGEFAVVDPTLPRLLCRPAISLREFLRTTLPAV